MNPKLSFLLRVVFLTTSTTFLLVSSRPTGNTERAHDVNSSLTAGPALCTPFEAPGAASNSMFSPPFAFEKDDEADDDGDTANDADDGYSSDEDDEAGSGLAEDALRRRRWHRKRKCYWAGTAPFCAGVCKPGDILRKRSVYGDGARCWTGTKVYCCPPPPPTSPLPRLPPSKEKERKGKERGRKWKKNKKSRKDRKSRKSKTKTHAPKPTRTVTTGTVTIIPPTISIPIPTPPVGGPQIPLPVPKPVPNPRKSPKAPSQPGQPSGSGKDKKNKKKSKGKGEGGPQSPGAPPTTGGPPPSSPPLPPLPPVPEAEDNLDGTYVDVVRDVMAGFRGISKLNFMGRFGEFGIDSYANEDAHELEPEDGAAEESV